MATNKPISIGPITESIVRRFWKYVIKDGPIPEHMPHLGPCWLWVGSMRKRYGSLAVYREHKSVTLRVNRISYAIHYGDPGALFVCHHCDNTFCVRPDHLFLGNDLDNVTDMHSKGRGKSGASLHPESFPRGKDHWANKFPERRVTRERHGRFWITDEMEDEIRSLYAAGLFNQYQLADKFGMNQATVSKIILRQAKRPLSA